MSDQDSSQEKTHEPTEKRKQDFREKGQIPRSREVMGAFGLALGSLIIMVAMPTIGHEFGRLVQLSFANAADGSLNILTIHSLGGMVMQSLITMLGIPMLLIWVTSILVGLLQAQFVIPTKEVLKIQWEKLNPVDQMKQQWFSMSPLLELAKENHSPVGLSRDSTPSTALLFFSSSCLSHWMWQASRASPPCAAGSRSGHATSPTLTARAASRGSRCPCSCWRTRRTIWCR